MISRPIDLVGIIQLSWRREWYDSLLEIKGYKSESVKLRASTSRTSTPTSTISLLLNASAVLSVILSTVQLRRTFADEIEVEGDRKIHRYSRGVEIFAISTLHNLILNITSYSIISSKADF